VWSRATGSWLGGAARALQLSVDRRTQCLGWRGSRANRPNRLYIVPPCRGDRRGVCRRSDRGGGM
jgi:hypothetical protein